jgi:hypothetical protein
MSFAQSNASSSYEEPIAERNSVLVIFFTKKALSNFSSALIKAMPTQWGDKLQETYMPFKYQDNLLGV